MAFPVALGPISKWGASIKRKAPEKIVFVVPLYFLTLKAQLVVLVSAIVMVNTVWSVSSLLFFYSRCPRAQPFVIVWFCPPCPWSRRHWAFPSKSNNLDPNPNRNSNSKEVYEDIFVLLAMFTFPK